MNSSFDTKTLLQQFEMHRANNKSIAKRYLILEIVTSVPGIRYRDLLRITKFNNGTLSYHLLRLEKKLMIRKLRSEKGHVASFYPYDFQIEEAITLGYLRIKTTRQILMLLNDKGKYSFSEIVTHINKTPSTTSWHLKRLVKSNIVAKTTNKQNCEFLLINPQLVEKLLYPPKTDACFDCGIDNGNFGNDKHSYYE